MALDRQSEHFNRKEVLEKGIERLRKLLEAEVMAGKSLLPKSPHGAARSVSSSLAALLASKERLTPKNRAPYEQFFKGVCVGLDHVGKHNWVTAGFDPAGEVARAGDPALHHAPRLSVHPVFVGADRSRWVTLETRVDKPHGAAATELGVHVVARFHFADPQQAAHINTVGVTLRCEQTDGTFEDSEMAFFPITTVPMGHAIAIKIAALKEAIKTDGATLRLIFWLPTHGAYSFELFDIAMDVV